VLANGRLVGELGPIFVGIRCGSLVPDVALSIDHDQLRHDHAVRKAEAHEGHHLIAGYVTDRKTDLELLDESLDNLVSLVVGAAFIERVDGDVQRLETSRPILLLEIRHNVGGGLAVGTSGQDEFECNHLAAVLTEQLLALPGNIEGQFRRFAGALCPSGQQTKRCNGNGRDRKQGRFQNLLQKIILPGPNKPGSLAAFQDCLCNFFLTLTRYSAYRR